MIANNNKIRNTVLAFFIAFSCIILLLLFVMQIGLLNQYYEIYQTKKLNKIKDEILSKDVIDDKYLEDLSYNNGICMAIFSNDNTVTVANSYNRGCAIGDTKADLTFINKFIESGKSEDQIIIKTYRFKNNTLLKGIKLDENLYIFLNAPIQPLDASLTLIKNQYIYIVIAMLIIAILISSLISKILTDPIVKISDSANKLAKGNFDVTFQTNSNIKEIKNLSETLERAKNELSKTDSLRKDLMANVGHDLKTPLTMIKAYAEMTRDINQNKEKRQENMNIIIEETDRLTLLVNDILNLSKLQSETYELKLEKFDINELIKAIIKRYKVLIKDEKYNFIYEGTGQVFVEADKTRIEQVIYNLINNAVNYTGNDKKVYINLKEEKKFVRVEVIDTGNGINDEDIKNIWNKYYHNELKHKRNTYGTGLGLSIVKTILESHGYKYGVNSSKGNGTMFYFEINRKN